MKNSIINILSVLSTITFGCQNSKLKNADWMIGVWEYQSDYAIIYESWIKKNDSEFAGKSYYILKGKDTVTLEIMSLKQENDTLFYVPTVKNQNDNLPIHFVCKNISENKLVFENLQHDFPQIITYSKINNDSIEAEISGKDNGEYRKESFRMKRKK